MFFEFNLKIFLAQFNDFLTHLIAASSTTQNTQSKDNKDFLTNETFVEKAQAFANFTSFLGGSNLNEGFNNENLFKGKNYF